MNSNDGKYGGHRIAPPSPALVHAGSMWRRTIRFGWLAFALSAVGVISACVTPVGDIHTPDLSNLKDGDYTGAYDGGLVKAEVNVILRDHKITGITILKHDCGRGKPAEVIVEQVLAAQSLDVDGISGATHSSQVILKAIELALK